MKIHNADADDILAVLWMGLLLPDFDIFL
jgi:hypothetical protein